MYNRITFAKMLPNHGSELGEFFEREIAAKQRQIRGNWRELLLEDDDHPGEIRYFSVWYEKEYADAYAATGGFDRTASALRPFLTEDAIVKEFDTYGYHRPLPDESPADSR